MLTKLLDISSYYREDEPQVTIIDLTSSRKGLIKQAADSKILEYTSKLQPENGKTYIHILAMSAGEFYGANRNGDTFPEMNLIDSHKTFETSPAHVFRNHVNKNKDIAIGKVILSVYNERMKRVELICELYNDRAVDVIDEINKGKWPKTSMACKTAYDCCSICGNKAHTRQEYCEHLSEDLNRIYPDGRKVMALNVAPLKFFDISIISGRQADPTSYVLQKLASVNDVAESSVDAATAEGLDEIYAEKSASLKKLSEFIKEIEGDVVYADPNLDNILSRVRDPEHKILDVLRLYPINEVFSTMAHLGVSPSLAFIAELISRKLLGKDGEGLGQIASSYMSSIGIDEMPLPDKDFGQATGPNIGVQNCLNPYLPGASFLPQYVEDRAIMTKAALEGNYFLRGTNVGYAGNGPHIEPTVYEQFRQNQLVPNEGNKSSLINIMNTIMAIGGAALAAKWFITRTIEEKMKEQELNTLSDGVKIRLVKSASDYKLTYKLAKAAMVKLVQKKRID
jgi:hypothetical protein